MPTAADMAQLGAEIVAGHQSRSIGIGGIFAAAQELAAQTGEFVERLQQASRGRKQENARLMRVLRSGDKARRATARKHAADTGKFLVEVRLGTQDRQAEVFQFMGEVSEFVKRLQQGTRARQRENAQRMRELRTEDQARQAATRARQREVRAQLGATAADMRGARKGWREQLAPKGKATASTEGAAKPAQAKASTKRSAKSPT